MSAVKSLLVRRNWFYDFIIRGILVDLAEWHNANDHSRDISEDGVCLGYIITAYTLKMTWFTDYKEASTYLKIHLEILRSSLLLTRSTKMEKNSRMAQKYPWRISIHLP